MLECEFQMSLLSSKRIQAECWRIANWQFFHEAKLIF